MSALREAPVTCEGCSAGHGTSLAKPCGVYGCECFCNRTSTAIVRRVLFASAFRRPGAENISHVSIDGVRTLCGRRVEEAEEVVIDSSAQPDCRTCRKVLA